MQFALRDAVSGDEFAIKRVVGDVLREHGFVLEPDGFDADLNDVALYHRSGGLFRVLIDEADSIVGCGGLFPLNAREAEIRKMYVLAHARGLGYGRRILGDLIAHARGGGFQRVVLETSSRLPGAGAYLYRQFGFVDVLHEHPSNRSDLAMALSLS